MQASFYQIPFCRSATSSTTHHSHSAPRPTIMPVVYIKLVCFLVATDTIISARQSPQQNCLQPREIYFKYCIFNVVNVLTSHEGNFTQDLHPIPSLKKCEFSSREDLLEYCTDSTVQYIYTILRHILTQHLLYVPNACGILVSIRNVRDKGRILPQSNLALHFILYRYFPLTSSTLI